MTYYEKYLKYKNKYILIKNQIGGGNITKHILDLIKNKNYIVNLGENSILLDLKEDIKSKSGIDVENQRILYGKTILEPNDLQLNDANIPNILFLVEVHDIQAYLQKFENKNVLDTRQLPYIPVNNLKGIYESTNVLFVKRAGDMGSLVLFHPKQKYVIKMHQYEKILREEYEKYKSMLNQNLPLPKLYGWYEINKNDMHFIDKKYSPFCMVTAFGGLTLHEKFNNNNNTCKQIWIENLVKVVKQFAIAGYIQEDWSNIGNFLIDDEDNVFLIDVASMSYNKPNIINNKLKETFEKLELLIKPYCEIKIRDF